MSDSISAENEDSREWRRWTWRRDGAGMRHNFPGGAQTAGFDHFVAAHAEDRALVNNFAAENARSAARRCCSQAHACIPFEANCSDLTRSPSIQHILSAPKI